MRGRDLDHRQGAWPLNDKIDCKLFQKLFLLACLLLSGCAAQVEPEVRTVRVEVPVQVPCRAPEVAVPAWAAADLRKSDNLEVKVRALLAERRQRIGYEREVVAALQACR